MFLFRSNQDKGETMSVLPQLHPFFFSKYGYFWLQKNTRWLWLWCHGGSVHCLLYSLCNLHHGWNPWFLRRWNLSSVTCCVRLWNTHSRDEGMQKAGEPFQENLPLISFFSFLFLDAIGCFLRDSFMIDKRQTCPLSLQRPALNCCHGTMCGSIHYFKPACIEKIDALFWLVGNAKQCLRRTWNYRALSLL